MISITLKSEAKMFKALAVLILLLSGTLMTGCVTETRGGFNADVSEERAIENYLKLSMGYLAQNDLIGARRHLNNAMELDSNNSVAHGIWGLIYSTEGDTDLADQSFRRSLKINPSDSQIRNNYAAFLFANERFDEAYEELATVINDTQYTGRAQAFENMGRAALQLKNMDDAEYAFERALQLNPNQLQSSFELVDFNLNKGDITKAQDFYSKASTLMLFYNVDETPTSIELGKRLEEAINNIRNIDE